MDGLQASLTRSLQFRLSLWLAIAIVAVALLTGALAYAIAFDEAIEIQDGQLIQIGALIQRQRGSFEAPPPGAVSNEVDLDARVVVQPLPQGDPHDPQARSQKIERGDLAGLPAGLADGIQTRIAGGRSWRLFVVTTARGERLAVGQPTRVREGVARTNALGTLLPLLALIPILLLLVGLVVRRIFRPVQLVAREIDGRSESDMSAIDGTRLPGEIHPFVVAINRLLVRIEESMATQRRFVADAAHELRSPLTALTLQAERAAEATSLPDAAERIAILRTGLARSRALLEQLLGLARAQTAVVAPQPNMPSALPVPPLLALRKAVQGLLEDLMPLAESKKLDLGMVGAHDAAVVASEIDLKALLRNLIENAVRYTPAGGQIDVSVEAGADSVTVRIDDTGPGIAADERERVFDPFYRIAGSGAAGSGLGLAIARTIASRLGAQIVLGQTAIPGAVSGLGVSIAFRAQRPTDRD